MIARLMDWLDDRTGLKAVRAVLFDEPLPPGTGWFFTLGSVLLALLGVQILTGAFLTLYYAPTPDHAYDSVRFISSTTSGRLVRGLHHFGASFIVVAAALHMLRVIAFGSYKRPRELTWLSGVALLGLILAFALTGYLLPWDQRAYWATVVTINISRLAPVRGRHGGRRAAGRRVDRRADADALVLRARHLPARPRGRHRRRASRADAPQGHLGSGAGARGNADRRSTRDRRRGTSPSSRSSCWRSSLMAWRGMPAMEGPADPTDATFIPRPEWYFLGLFQLLKYFPGKLEVVGAIILPTVLGALLALLPWLDRGPDRDPRRRLVVMLGVAAGVLGIVALTTLGWRDRPVSAPAGDVVDARDRRAAVRGRGEVRALPFRERDGGRRSRRSRCRGARNGSTDT